MARIRGLKQIYQSQTISTPLLRVDGSNNSILTFVGSVLSFEKDGTGALLQLVNPNQLLFTANSGTSHIIGTDSIDGSDNRNLILSASNAAAAGRGAYILLGGNEALSNSQKAIISSGSGPNAAIVFQHSGTDTWFINTGALAPFGSNTTDLGTDTNRIRRIYASTELRVEAISRAGSTPVFDLTPSSVATTHVTLQGTSGGKLTTSSSDAADNRSLHIGGGGDALATRGAFIGLYGNEHSTNAGQLVLTSGSVGSIITDTPGNTSFRNNGADILRVESGAVVFFRPFLYNQAASLIAADTADGADNKRLEICGGGAASSTRGGRITLSGNESGNQGLVEIVAGDVASGQGVRLTTIGTQPVEFWTQATKRWFIDSAGDYRFTSTSGLIGPDTIDGSDNKRLLLCGGGSQGDTRGGTIYLYGNEHGSTGSVEILAGGAGSIFFETLNLVQWQVQNAGHFVPGSHNSKDIGTSSVGVRDIYLRDLLVRGAITGTASSTLNITTGTTDESDNQAVFINGGGGTPATRGASVLAYGNEHATHPGKLQLFGGSGGIGGKIELTTFNAMPIEFRTSGTLRWLVDSSGHLVPSSNNTYDLGNSSAIARVLYTAKVASSGNLSFNAGTALTNRFSFQFNDVEWGRIHATGNIFTLQGNNANTEIFSGGATTSLKVGAGASVGAGGQIALYGDSHASAGDVDIIAGNVSGGNVTLRTLHSTSAIHFATANVSRWSVDGSGHIVPVSGSTYDIGTPSERVRNIYADSLVGGGGGVVGADQLQYAGISNTYNVYADTSDGTDNKQIIISGGGSSASSRGASVSINGNEFAGGNGFGSSIRLSTGDTANARIINILNNASASWQVNDGTNTLWSFKQTGEFEQASAGGPIVFSVTDAIIRQNTSDGADNKSISIASGGDILAVRGAYIQVRGNEYASNPGLAQINAGNVTNGRVELVAAHSTGRIDSIIGSTVRTRVQSTQPWLTIFGDAITNVASPMVSAYIPDTLGNRGGFSLANSQGTSLGGMTAEVVATGAYPNAIGRLDLWVQNLSSTFYAIRMQHSRIDLYAQNQVRMAVESNLVSFFPDGTERWNFSGSNVLQFRQSSEIRAVTSDGADNQSIAIASGGLVAASRGAHMILYGADHATNSSEVSIQSGNSGSGVITLRSNRNNTGVLIKFITNDDNSGFNISRNSSVSADFLPITDSQNNLGSSGKRFGTVFARNFKMASGDLNVGTTTSNDIRLQTGNSTKWTVQSAGHFVPFSDVTFDIGSASNRVRNAYLDVIKTARVEFTLTDSTLIHTTTDGSDIGSIQLCGGGAVGSTRGGNVRIFGNEHGTSPGQIILRAGDVATGHIYIDTPNSSGEIIFRQQDGLTERWKINTSGHFVPVANNTHDLGTSSLRIRKLYVEDLDVAGTSVGIQQFTWNTVTGTSQSMLGDNGYIVNNAGLVTLTLPATCEVGKIIEVVGMGAGGWRIAQNADQVIHVGDTDTTTGVSGQINSTHRRDTIRILCIVADTEFTVLSAVGTLDIV